MSRDLPPLGHRSFADWRRSRLRVYEEIARDGDHDRLDECVSVLVGIPGDDDDPFGPVPFDPDKFENVVARACEHQSGGLAVDRVALETVLEKWRPVLLEHHRSLARDARQESEKESRRLTRRGSYRKVWLVSGRRLLVQQIGTGEQLRIRVLPIDEGIEYDAAGSQPVQIPNVGQETFQGDLRQAYPLMLLAAGLGENVGPVNVEPAAQERFPPDVYGPVIHELYDLITRKPDNPDERAPRNTWSTIRSFLSAFDLTCYNVTPETLRSIHKRRTR